MLIAQVTLSFLYNLTKMKFKNIQMNLIDIEVILLSIYEFCII